MISVLIPVTCCIHVLMKFLALPLLTACKRPISPHAFLIVCLYQMTGSLEPLPLYSGRAASSCTRNDSYDLLIGKTRSRALAGRGTKARSSGSSMLKTSWNERAVESPSLWTRELITSGLFSAIGMISSVPEQVKIVEIPRGTNALCVLGTSGSSSVTEVVSEI